MVNHPQCCPVLPASIRMALPICCSCAAMMFTRLRMVLCGVVAFANVNVDSASAAWSALCACLSEQSDDLLQGFNVVVGEDWGDQFAFFCVRSVDAHIPLEFPNPACLVLQAQL